MTRSINDLHPPVIVSARTVVLLVFIPPAYELLGRLKTMTRSLQQQFDRQLRVLLLDEVSQPEVVRSFGITQTPTFVLVRLGVELWRAEGFPDETVLIHHAQEALAG